MPGVAYTTISAYVGTDVKQAAIVAARRRGKRLSRYLGEVISERVLADAGMPELAARRAAALKELADIDASAGRFVAAEIGRQTAAEIRKETVPEVPAQEVAS